MKHLFIFSCSMVLSLSAYAQKGAVYSPPPPKDNLNWGQNWYMGFGINTDVASNMQGQPEAFVDIELEELELEKTHVGFDVYLGRSINNHFAVEVGYTFVGNVDLELTSTVSSGGGGGGGPSPKLATSTTTHYSGKVEQWKIDVVALGRWPIGEYVNLMINGGAGWYENRQNLQKTNDTGNTVHDKYSGFALVYGGGLEVFWDQFGVRMDYTAILPPNIAEEMLYISDVVGVSFLYKFR